MLGETGASVLGERDGKEKVPKWVCMCEESKNGPNSITNQKEFKVFFRGEGLCWLGGSRFPVVGAGSWVLPIGEHPSPPLFVLAG